MGMSLRAAIRQSKIEQEKREKEAAKQAALLLAKEKKNNLKKKATSSNNNSKDGNNNNNNAGKSYFCFECETVIEDGRGRTVVKLVGCEFSGKCENWVCETCAKKKWIRK